MLRLAWLYSLRLRLRLQMGAAIDCRFEPGSFPLLMAHTMS